MDRLPVWSLSCFFVRRQYRRRGVMTALIDEAVKRARESGAPALEAYPVDTSQPRSSSNIFTGTAAAFERAGFRTVAVRSPERPIMRLDLQSAPASP